MAIILKCTNYERDSNIYLHCKLQKIPYKIITLRPKKRRRDGYELVITIDNLLAYNLLIMQCQFSET